MVGPDPLLAATGTGVDELDREEELVPTPGTTGRDTGMGSGCRISLRRPLDPKRRGLAYIDLSRACFSSGGSWLGGKIIGRNCSPVRHQQHHTHLLNIIIIVWYY